MTSALLLSPFLPDWARPSLAKERKWRNLALPAINLEFSPVAATSPRDSLPTR